jgi:hypothetical protein
VKGSRPADLSEEGRTLRGLRSKKIWIAVAVGVAVVGTIASVALGLPGAGVTPTNLVTANLEHAVHWNSDKVKFQTKNATDVRVQRLDFAAGSYSGWHHHPGIVIVAVASGSVRVWQSDCSSVTYGPTSPNGSVFTEGDDHPVQATSASGATVYVTYVAPDGAGFRVEDNLPADHCS